MKKTGEIVIVGAIIFAAFYLRHVDPYYLADLAIVPDSAQYAIGGWNLASGKGLWIYINNIQLPLQYPPGTPIILSVFYRLSGLELHSAIYIVLAFSLVSVALVYLFARSVFGVPQAILSAALLAAAPQYIGYSQVLISDMMSNTFIIFGLWLAWSAALKKSGHNRLWFIAGLLLGFSSSVHLLSGLSIIPLLVAALLPAERRPRQILRHFGTAACGFAIGFSPVLVYNRCAFGSIFATGYDYWARWGEGQSNFAIHYAWNNTAVPELGDGRGNISFYMAHFLGLSWPTLFAPYFPAVLFLAGCGAVSCLINRDGRRPGPYIFSAMSITLIASVVIVLFFYSFQMAKFLLPIIPFVCILAAAGTVILIKPCIGKETRPRLLRIPVVILLAVTAWGLWKPIEKSLSPTHAPTWWYEGLTALDKIAPPDALLISGIDGVYATHYFVKNTERAYIPISRQVEYIMQRDLPLAVAIESMDEIERTIKAGRKVYLDGFTVIFWGGPAATLAHRFNLKPVAPYYGGRLFIYELNLKDGD